MICYKINLVFNKMEENFQSNELDWSSLVIKVSDFSRKPFCFRFVFSLLRFPTLVGNLSVFVLSFLYFSSSFFFISFSIHNFVHFQPIDFKFSTDVKNN